MSTMLDRPRTDRNFDYTAHDAIEVLYCRISLARDWRSDLAGTSREAERTIVLDHKRDARTPRRYVHLKPGKSVQLPLDLAEAFFGRFSVAILERITEARTESAKRRLGEEYAMTRAQAILRWGDFPRLARAGSGMTYEPLGPARLPDVTVTIIPAEEDETTAADRRYKPVRLRALYDLGDYFDAEHLANPGGFAGRRALEDERQAKSDFEAAQTRMAQLEGTVATLTALLAANPELEAKLATLTKPAKAGNGK